MNANQTDLTPGTDQIVKGPPTLNASPASFPRRLIGKIWRSIHTFGLFCVALFVRTPMRRWRRVASNPNPVWDERNRMIAGFIPADSAVLDIGCGGQSLKRHLKAGCKYQPSDLVQSTPDVVICDFNAGVIPKFPERFDYVVCSGVLEYIRNPKQFLELVASYGETTILSYHPYNKSQWKGTRIAANWVNHFSEAELLKLFEEAGLTWKVLHGMGGSETIYRLQRS